MWQTGVGLTLLPLPIASPMDMQLMEDMNRSIQLLYEKLKLKRGRDDEVVVANLLGALGIASRK